MTNHHYKTWGEAAGQPETSVPLAALPAGLHFPDDFPEPIHYDAQRRRLAYRGLMFSASYRFLRELHDDTAYTAALDVLFQQTANAGHERPRGSGLRFVVAGATGLVAAAAAWLMFR